MEFQNIINVYSTLEIHCFKLLKLKKKQEDKARFKSAFGNNLIYYHFIKIEHEFARDNPTSEKSIFCIITDYIYIRLKIKQNSVRIRSLS